MADEFDLCFFVMAVPEEFNGAEELCGARPTLTTAAIVAPYHELILNRYSNPQFIGRVEKYS